MAYPTGAALERMLAELARVNDFTVADVMGNKDPRRCCIVQHLPPGKGARRRRGVYYGIDADGYVIARAAAARGGGGWPVLSTGEPAPVRVHRAVSVIPPHMMGMHACDEPACIRRLHITAGAACDNNSEAHERGRRWAAAAAASSSAAAVRTPRLTGSPVKPARARLGAASEARERLFCVAGFSSPSKRARALARAAAGALEAAAGGEPGS